MIACDLLCPTKINNFKRAIYSHFIRRSNNEAPNGFSHVFVPGHLCGFLYSRHMLNIISHVGLHFIVKLVILVGQLHQLAV